MFYNTLKSIVLSLILLISIASHSYADFYVIPVTKEVCNGVPAGVEAFGLNLEGSSYDFLYVGDLWMTNEGYFIQITGSSVSVSLIFYSDDKFSLSPELLPEPSYGLKGDYYFLNSGDIIYANYL